MRAPFSIAPRTDMPNDDRDYFYRRAEMELKLAAESRCPPAVKAHYELAGHYLERVYAEADNSGLTHDDA
jgi:hypothetical protein